MPPRPEPGSWRSAEYGPPEDRNDPERREEAAKVYRDAEWQEYRVKFFRDGKYQEDADYHTDDKADAQFTARAFCWGK